MTQMLELTWGDRLVVKVHRTRVGLQPYVVAIQEAVGKHIGSRPTFAKLYDVQRADELTGTDALRAWLLLTAMGENPDDWGVRATLPPATDPKRLQKILRDLVRRQGLSTPGSQSASTCK